ncbi:MAG: cytoplasmic protein [Pseudomonadota bacterium]|nr:cytoplasmic protein [Pseudomonadota bacterium]
MRWKSLTAKAAGLAGVAALLAGAAAGQDAAKAQPGSYRVVLENSSVRVLEYNGRPGMGVCGSGVHSHPAHLTILLTPARVRVTDHGRTFVAINKAGDAFWSGPVTHETENIGGANVRSLIVELKAPAHGR